MLLVDTSVWIEAFRRRSSFRVQDTIDLDDVVTAPPILQEVVQGFRDEHAFHTARSAMTSLPIVESPMTWPVFLEAAQLYRAARRQGVTVRSSIDCLIAACALRHQLTVVHRDRDFDALARVAPLRVRRL